MSRRPIAFNNSTKTANSIKKNKVEVGVASDNYASSPGGLTWFNGADSTNQYVIYSDTFSLGMTTLANAKPVCWASGDLTDVNVLRMINGLPTRYNQTPFTTIASALEFVAASAIFNMVSGTLDNIVTDGLVLNVDASQKGSYPGSGTTSYDLAGANNGILINGTNYLTTNGGIFEFDGTNDYISFGNDISLNPIYITMSIFVKFNSFSSRPHFGKGGGSTGAYYIVVESNSVLTFYYTIGNTGGWSSLGGPSLSINTWYNIVITYDGSQPKIYLNGQLNSFTNSSGTLKTTDNDNLKIGGYGGNPGYPLNGFSNGLMLYNRALSAAEVLQNYNAQKTKFGL